MTEPVVNLIGKYSTVDQISKAPACPVIEPVVNLIGKYSTVGQISKAPACPVTEPVMSPIIGTMLQSAAKGGREWKGGRRGGDTYQVRRNRHSPFSNIHTFTVEREVEAEAQEQGYGNVLIMRSTVT